MKKSIKLVSALLAAVMLLAAFAAGVYADVSYSDEDLAALIGALESTSGTDVTVSGADAAVSGADAAVSPSDTAGQSALSLNEAGLVELKLEKFGVDMLVPNLDASFSMNSDSETIGAFFGEGASVANLFDNSDYSGNGAFTYLYYGYIEDGSIIATLTYTESSYSKYVGSYASLSAAEQEAFAATTDLFGEGSSTASFRIINGQPYLYQEHTTTSEETGVSTSHFELQTIINGGKYELYMALNAPSSADLDAANRIIDSVSIKGFDHTVYGVASTCTTTWLIVLVIVLFVLVALLVFFLVRFALFAKASGSSFNIIGFDMPAASGRSFADNAPDETYGEDGKNEDSDE